MKRIICILFTLISIATMAQNYFYRGRSSYSGDILLTFDGSYIYRGKSTYSGDILYTVSGGYIYRGKSTYSGDVLYSFSGILPVPVLVMMMQ